MNVCASLHELQDRLPGLVARARGIDLRPFEIAPFDDVLRELVPVTRSLLADARALLREVAEACVGGERHGEPAAHSFLPFERVLDATVATRLGSREAVDEIAFIAQLELRQREERLERAALARGAPGLLAECDSAVRRIRKALNAVDAAIATAEHVPPRLDFTSELQTSLAVRRAYARFRATIVEAGVPTEVTLRARFRAVGTRIAILVGLDIYPDLRVQDRLLIRELQQRLLVWLRGGPEEATAGAGMRLWQDLAACVEIFGLVNRRQELVEHDAVLVRELAADVTGGEVDWSRVAELEGLDSELDTLIADPARRSASAAASIASRLAGATSDEVTR